MPELQLLKAELPTSEGSPHPTDGTQLSRNISWKSPTKTKSIFHLMILLEGYISAVPVAVERFHLYS